MGAEAGPEGRAQQVEMVELARQYGMLVCGPNCMGLVSIANRQAMYAGGIATRRPDGRIAAVCQSGSLLSNSRIALSHMISSGNEAVVTLAEYLAYLVEDPQTDVLLAFVEGFRSPDLFLQVADRARELEKPLIVLKVGTSERAAAAALAHTGALAGSSAVFEAVCQQKGIIRVNDLDEMIETARLFAAMRGRLPRGKRVGSITASGGQVALLLDIAEPLGVEFPELTPPTRAALGEVLGSVPAISNPLDAWGTGDIQRTYPRCLELLANDENVDVLAVCRDAPAVEDAHLAATQRPVASATAQVAKTVDKPFVVFTTFSGATDPEVVQTLGGSGIPLLLGTRAGLKAVASLTRYAEFLRREVQLPSESEAAADDGLAGLLAAEQRVLSEEKSMQVLTRFGVPVARHALVSSAAEAVAAAERIGFPVALKVCSPDLPHKTNAGAVRLKLADRPAVRGAYAEILANARRAAPRAAIEGVLVQEMLSGVELIAGVARDPDFGPVVLLGIGGIFVEVLRDVSLRLAPLTRADAEAMIQELRGRRLLEGHRRLPAVDKQAIVEVLLGLSRLVVACRDQIDQIDINPLIASAGGAAAADALVVRRDRLPAGARTAQEAVV